MHAYMDLPECACAYDKDGGYIMIKIEKYIGILIVTLLASLFLTAKPAQAASAEVEISADTNQVTVGEDFFVYIRINSDTMFADFEANLTYDDNLLEYTDGASVITGSSGFLKISDFGLAEGSTNRKYTLKFHALKTGNVEISFTGQPMVYDFETGDEMSISSNVLQIEVKPAQTASDNAYLKSLKVSPSGITPEFDRNVLEYSMKVASNVDKLVINALPEDVNATVTISGNDLLKEGENKIIVTVLAESGTIIEYIINVLKEPASIEEIEDEPTIAPERTQSLFEIVRMDGEVYAIYSGRYKLVEPGSDVKIPEGYHQDTVILSNVSIKAYFSDDDKDRIASDFFLIYAENEFGEQGFYQYDRQEKTLQRYAPEYTKGPSKVVVSEENDNMQAKEYRANLTKAAVVIAVLASLCALLVIVLIRIYINQRDR